MGEKLSRRIQKRIMDPGIIEGVGTFIYCTSTKRYLFLLRNSSKEHRGYCWVRLEDHPKPLHPGVWRTINFEAVASKIKTLESIL